MCTIFYDQHSSVQQYIWTYFLCLQYFSPLIFHIECYSFACHMKVASNFYFRVERSGMKEIVKIFMSSRVRAEANVHK